MEKLKRAFIVAAVMVVAAFAGRVVGRRV